MLAIKLQRIGKKHQPSYRVVVAERRSKMDAPPVEDLGSYNPFTKAMAVKKERVEHWLKVGAQPTPSVWNLFVQGGVVSGAKIAIRIKKSAEVRAPAETAASPAAGEAVSAAPLETPTAEENAAPAAE